MFLFLRSLFLSAFLYVTITPYSLLTSAGVMPPFSYLNLPIFKCWIPSCANVVSASPHLAVASLPTHLMSSAFSPSSHPPSLFTSQFDSSASPFPVLLFNKTAHSCLCLLWKCAIGPNLPVCTNQVTWTWFCTTSPPHTHTENWSISDQTGNWTCLQN